MFEEQTENSLWSLLNQMKAAPVDPELAKYDRELTPILAELTTLQPGNHDHPVRNQLFNWLVEPHRTVEEFLYASIILREHVYDIMDTHFKHYLVEGTEIAISKIALEALAVICPTLKGPWEQVTWFLAGLYDWFDYPIERFKFGYPIDIYGPASKHLTNWLILIIGDSDLCPNIYLRFALLRLLCHTSDPKHCSQEQALETILSACSMLCMDYPDINLNIIQEALTLTQAKKCLLNFDEQLLGMEGSRLSALIYDVAYDAAVSPNKLANPMSFNGLSRLLVYLSGRARLAMSQGWQDMLPGDLDADILNLRIILQKVKKYLPKSLQTPQLADQVATSIKDVEKLSALSNENIIRNYNVFRQNHPSQ